MPIAHIIMALASMAACLSMALVCAAQLRDLLIAAEDLDLLPVRKPSRHPGHAMAGGRFGHHAGIYG